MKTAEWFLGRMQGEKTEAERVKVIGVIREIQADALRAAAEFSFTEREFSLAAQLVDAARSIEALGISPTPVPA